MRSAGEWASVPAPPCAWPRKGTHKDRHTIDRQAPRGTIPLPRGMAMPSPHNAFFAAALAALPHG